MWWAASIMGRVDFPHPWAVISLLFHMQPHTPSGICETQNIKKKWKSLIPQSGIKGTYVAPHYLQDLSTWQRWILFLRLLILLQIVEQLQNDQVGISIQKCAMKNVCSIMGRGVVSRLLPIRDHTRLSLWWFLTISACDRTTNGAPGAVWDTYWFWIQLRTAQRTRSSFLIFLYNSQCTSHSLWLFN